MHKPSSLHLQHLKHLLRYLKGTLNYGLQLKKLSNLHLLTYILWCRLGWKFGWPHFNLYLPCLSRWESKKQHIVARSSTEAKYRSVATATTEVMWLSNLLTKLRFHLTQPPLILCDNIGAMYLCANPIQHSRMKHISLDYYFVNDSIGKEGWPAPTCQKRGGAKRAELGRRAQHFNPPYLRAGWPAKKIKNI